MLSRIRLNRGIISFRPSRLPAQPIPQNLYIQPLPSGRRTYAQYASRVSETTAGERSAPNDGAIEHSRSSENPEPHAPAQQPQGAIEDGSSGDLTTSTEVAKPRRGRPPVVLTPEEIEAKRLLKQAQKKEYYLRKKAKNVVCPPGMAEEEFNAMPIEGKVRIYEEQVAKAQGEKKQAALRRALNGQVLEGMDPEEFREMPVEVRATLLARGKEVVPKWKPSQNRLNAAELSLEALRLEKEGEIEIVPKPRKKRSDAGIKKKNLGLVSESEKCPDAGVKRKKLKLAGARKKLPTQGTKAVQYQREVVQAMREAGVELEGNDLDFAQGGMLASADKSRMNIIGQSLIDDVLERLGPSLEKHKGCDLIDINPGVGFWSSKLHDVLKPRSHIMMEPDHIYRRQLQRLVDKDPTYKLVPQSGVIWQNLLKIEEGKMLPHQTWRRLGDPELDKPNDTLLVTVNLGYYPRRSYLGFASITHLVLHQLFTATRAHSIFQAYGQVRMLVWVHDFEKRIIVPRTLSLRKKSSLEAETCSAYIHEICGADGSAENSQRGRDVNLQSARRVRKKMDEAGISNPPHRMSKLEADMKRVIESEGDVEDRAFDRLWHEDFELLTRGLVDGKFAMYIDPKSGEHHYAKSEDDLNARAPKGLGESLSPEYYKWIQLKRRAVSEDNQEAKVQTAVSAYEALEAQWLSVQKSTIPSEEEKKTQSGEIEAEIEKWIEAVSCKPMQQRTRITQHITERHAVRQDPPILEWDRREFEPLVVKPEEFHPRQEMALLDIQPRTIWPSLSKNDLGDYDYFEILLSCLCNNPGKSIVERLKSFAPGADEWILPRCPTLRNVEKGGMINLEMLTVRNMSEEMLREVFEQFMAWPFRPTKGRMLQMMGSTSVHEADGEENSSGGLQNW